MKPLVTDELWEVVAPLLTPAPGAVEGRPRLEEHGHDKGGAAVESKTKLGKHRWIVERTLAWIARYRRLTIRYERLVAVHRAFLHLACALSCWNYVQRSHGSRHAGPS